METPEARADIHMHFTRMNQPVNQSPLTFLKINWCAYYTKTHIHFNHGVHSLLVILGIYLAALLLGKYSSTIKTQFNSIVKYHTKKGCA